MKKTVVSILLILLIILSTIGCGNQPINDISVPEIESNLSSEVIISSTIESSEIESSSSEIVSENSSKDLVSDKNEESITVGNSIEESSEIISSKTESVSSNVTTEKVGKDKNTSKEDNKTSIETSTVSSEKKDTTTSTKVSSTKKNNSSSKKENTSSKKNTSSDKKDTSSKKENTKPDKTKKQFKVTDPNNKRGLSEKRYGVHFGTSKDGTPPQPSIDNQKRFDGYKNVDALALDMKTDEKIMYLTFDCGYEYKNLTGKILDTLKKKKVKAAFFVTESYIKNNPEFVKRMIKEGHIVGNHSATHPVFTDISRKEMAKEIEIVHKLLKDKFDYTSEYFRFPTGSHSENSLELVTSIGYKSIFWSIAYADWDTSAQKGKENAIKTVSSLFHPGAVILLHAVSSDNAKGLGGIIDKAHKKGYRFATLDEYYK